MLILVAGLSVPPASAFQNGITGFSGKQNQTCNACHVGGTTPEEVRFEGPAQVAAGATATFRFVVVSEAPSQDEAGFNVAASAGALRVIAGQGARLSANELTHTGPKDIDDNDEAAWQFNWIAPVVEGEQTLFGAANAVNGNGSTLGDRARTTTMKIQVVGGMPTPTATPTSAPFTPTRTATPTATRTLSATVTRSLTPTAAASPTMTETPIATPTNPPTDTPTTMPIATSTVTETITRSPTMNEAPTRTMSPAPSSSATPSPTESLAATATAAPTHTAQPACVGDCNADQRVTVAELVTGVNIAFERSAVAACRAIDRDADERVTVAELVEAVQRLLEGCSVVKLLVFDPISNLTTNNLTT